MIYFKLDGYSLLQHDSLCSGTPGKRSIETLEECENTVGYVQKIVPNTTEEIRLVIERDSPVVPKGCYLSDHGRIYFNTASTGSSSPLAREICIPGKNFEECTLYKLG